MPIVNMISNDRKEFPDGAYCDLYYSRQCKDAVVLYESHHGLCLHEFERNGYDDSDFIMTVWNPIKKKTENICFASTRGWSYPCYASSADATPEVMAEYQAWAAAIARRGRIIARRQNRLHAAKNRLAAGIDRTQWDRLRGSMSSADFERVIALLKVKNFRSEFRAKLALQVRKWLHEEAPQYASPLSRKQMMYV